jgi:hypothetical protein
MRNSTGSKRDVSGTNRKLFITYLDDVLSLEDVPELVLILMNVKGVSTGSTSSMMLNAPPVEVPEALTMISIPPNCGLSPPSAGTR